MNVDGAPTIFCFHASCAGAVAEANGRLRRELSASPWELRLPDGRTLRSGDVLQAGGAVVAREAMKAAARAAGREAGEQLVLMTVRRLAAQFRADLFEFFHWPVAEVLEDSPLAVSERDAEDQFRTWLKLWPACSTVWIGDVYSSGKPEHRTHFRPVGEWYQIGPVMGNFTCGSSFKPGSFSRSNENLTGHRFMVVESDTLSKDEVGAVFAYLRRRLRYPLHCIIDTAGKSLHGWFDAPRSKMLENRLKAGLEEFGCDPKVFTYSQPVRVPGAFRDGKLQKLVWLRH
ncbi:MAG: hypothetical protein KBB19_13905 [Giesbergeria sp.]|nr:hypothetical protein [Giesbergeria sp.]